ncbi:hypothetical protein BS47DRAFT_348393 [Hydnum rufescens UP504]|uniref:Uncharacterized protein n=1 Tax=Hydnum rufescens UP504 TaxID=1448309 RepID=A0A9P6AJS3_9AGAM|nr:hypothetical protein BS47DRAFT_348393 [Hydnum rufescens UP504]
MNPMDNVLSGEIRTNNVPGDDSERTENQRSEFDRAFIVDTQESVRPTSDILDGALLDGLQDHSGPSQDQGLTAPEHVEPPLVDVVPSSISDPALWVPMSSEPMSDINRPLARQLAENIELLQERNREIDRLRGQLVSVNASGGLSVLLGVKTKLIESLRAEASLHVREIRKLREDQEQNTRDLAAKVQHIAHIDRLREESEKLQISNRHLVGNQAELKAQIDHLKADKAAMAAKITSTEKLVTELSESLTTYAIREARTSDSSERVPGPTPVSTKAIETTGTTETTEVTRTQERGNIATISGLTVQLRDVEAKLHGGPSRSSPVNVEGDTINEPRIDPTMDVTLKDLQDCIESLNRRVSDHISRSGIREASLVEGLGANKTSFEARVSTLEQEKEGLRQEVEKLKVAAAEEAVFVGFMQTRYEEETTKASTLLKENVRLRAENEVVRSQVEEGVKQVRVFYQTAEEKLREELDQAQGEIRLLLEKERRVASRSADGMTQDYAALEKDLKEIAIDAVSWKRHVSLLGVSDVEIYDVDEESIGRR